MENHNDASRLHILFKVCSAHKYNMAYWLTIPEFIDEMYALKSKGILFNNQNVLDVMKRIYSGWEYLRESSEEKPAFNYHVARHGIHQIEKAIAEGK